ncbi:MAG: hypothetical protein PHC50_09120 [Candidatus Cloacimonetes bacterium]|nr:hypothetical protein [Candidatus Cloacimonadota bacterium]
MSDNVERAIRRAGEIFQSNWIHAVHLLQETAQEYDQDPRPQSALGDIFFQKQQFDKAVQFYLVALSLDPLNQDLPAIIANCYLAQFEYRLALAYYNRIVSPSDEVLYNKALTLAFLGKNQESMEILEAIMPRYSNHPLLYYLLVEQSYYAGDRNKALKYALIADKKSSAHFQRYILTGIIYHDLGNMFLSFNYFKKADELSPITRSEHLLAYAKTALATGLWRNALNILERTIKLHPDQSEAWEMIIRIYIDQDNFLMAQRYWDKAFKQFKRLSPVFRLLKKYLDSYK